MPALRAVNGGGEPTKRRAPARPRTPIKTAARSGDRRRLLVSLRDHIAQRLDEEVAPRDLASLSKRLVDIAEEIEAIDAAAEGDDVSDAADTPDEAWSPS